MPRALIGSLCAVAAIFAVKFNHVVLTFPDSSAMIEVLPPLTDDLVVVAGLILGGVAIYFIVSSEVAWWLRRWRRSTVIDSVTGGLFLACAILLPKWSYTMAYTAGKMGYYPPLTEEMLALLCIACLVMVAYYWSVVEVGFWRMCFRKERCSGSDSGDGQGSRHEGASDHDAT